MSSYSPFDHRQWGNRLVVKRSLDLWREYGAAAGLFELKKAWNTLLLTRDARELALIPKTISEKADYSFDNDIGGELQLWGGEMWEQYVDERQISQKEANVWKKNFIEAYSTDLEERLSEVIPTELDGKLDVFCNTVSSIARHLENGGDVEDYGVSLGKKVQEVAKIHPKKAEIISRAVKAGAEEANRNWGWQQTGSSSMQDPWPYVPSEWETDSIEESLYEKTFVEAYFSTLRDHFEKFVPKKVWKNAFLICSLYDEMQAQKDRNKKYGSQKGWSYIRTMRDREVRRTEERREYAAKVYDEKTSPKVASPTMGIFDPSAQFFSPHVIITSGAKAAFEKSGEQPAKYLDRHFSGDFGESTDVDLNRANMWDSGMVMSIYTLSTGVRFFIITDEGHKATTILLTEEY